MATKIMSGSYQDYVDGNTENKVFRFKLLKQNVSPSYVDSHGVPKRYPTLVPFPAIGIINEKNPEGKWVQRVIRYIPGEQSIYKDKQSDDIAVPKKTYKIVFEQGHKSISGTDRLLLEFIMKYNLNATNPNRKTDEQPWFELIDTDKAIKAAMKHDETLDEAKYFCRKGTWDEVRAMAMVLNLNQNFSVEETRWNLRIIAERDPNKFMALQQDPKMMKKYHVLEAISQGFLVTNTPNNSIAWVTNPNNALYVGPAGRDIVDGFVNQLSTTEGMVLYKAIIELIYAKDEKVNQVQAPSREEIDALKSKVNQNAVLIDAILPDHKILELIDKGITTGKITTKGNMPWLTYKAEKFAKEEGLLFDLKSKPEMLKSFIEDIG